MVTSGRLNDGSCCHSSILFPLRIKLLFGPDLDRSLSVEYVWDSLYHSIYQYPFVQTQFVNRKLLLICSFNTRHILQPDLSYFHVMHTRLFISQEVLCCSCLVRNCCEEEGGNCGQSCMRREEKRREHKKKEKRQR